jgi:cytochrome P450
MAEPAVDDRIPSLDLDPFSPEFLGDPYPGHERMREAGALVRLERHGIYAVARHAPVFAMLQDWRSYCSAAGVGLADFRREKPWRPPSLLLEADPPLHTRTRGAVAGVLSRAALNEMRPRFQAAADSLVEAVLAKGTIDAIGELARAFPMSVFPDEVGIDAEGRENLLPYGDMAFNAFGPRNALFDRAFERAEPVVAFITSRCRREALRPGKLGARLFEAADAGLVNEEEAALLVRSLLTAGIDTTVHGIGNALVALSRHPQEWARLHVEPTLARQAFDEAVRLESPVQTFFRTTTCVVEIDGASIGPDEKVLMFLGAANRDPRRWSGPDRLDIGRNAAGHVGFGAGIHGCVGQMIARLEGEVLLAAMARRIRAIEPAGEPVLHLNNTLRGWSSLPLRLHAA